MFATVVTENTRPKTLTTHCSATASLRKNASEMKAGGNCASTGRLCSAHVPAALRFPAHACSRRREPPGSSSVPGTCSSRTAAAKYVP
ncbi:MAG: hypothetical protein ACK55Z_36530, partial [bacterium]